MRLYALVAGYFLLSSWFLVVLVGPAVGFLADGSAVQDRDWPSRF
jgi:hypothetical protein